MNETTKRRLLPLDTLRGFASIYVVTFHLLLVPIPTLIISNHVFSQAIHFGGTGVFLFFIISGFSLSLTMPRHDGTASPAFSYGISRLFRIAPAFYFVLMLSALRDYFQFHTTQSIPNLILNASFVFNLVPNHQEGIVWASWTIGVEVLFYVLFLPLYRLGIAVQIVAAATAFVAFELLDRFASGPYTYWTFLGYFPLFVIGMLTFEAYAHLSGRWQKEAPIGAACIAAGMAVLFLCATFELAEKNVLLRVPIGLGYAAVLLGTLIYTPALLKTRVMLFYGRISYSLYLTHAPMIFTLSKFFRFMTKSLPTSVSYAACLVVALAVATPIAFLICKYIEEPGILLGKRILRMRHAAPPASPYRHS